MKCTKHTHYHYHLRGKTDQYISVNNILTFNNIAQMTNALALQHNQKKLHMKCTNHTVSLSFKR